MVVIAEHDNIDTAASADLGLVFNTKGADPRTRSADPPGGRIAPTPGRTLPSRFEQADQPHARRLPQSHGLGEQHPDVGQTPGDLVVLSFSDSDLGAFAAGWHRADGKLPSTRLANLVALKHPLSVDVYAEQTLEGAKGVLVRLIGGESYWSYGLATLQDLARRKGIALAILPADGQEDPRLDELPPCRFPPCAAFRRCTCRRCCRCAGAGAAGAGLWPLCQPVIQENRAEFQLLRPTGALDALPEIDKPLVLVGFMLLSTQPTPPLWMR